MEEPQEERALSAAALDPAERIVIASAERRAAVVDTINSAQRQLSLSLFRCDDRAVIEAIASAVARGVQVRALLTSRAKDSKAHLKELQKELTARGVDARRYPDPVVRYHAKYVIADARTALIASLNFTRKYFEATCDFMVLSNDSGVIVGLTRLFDADWNGASYRAGGGADDRLIVGPEYARQRFAALIGGACNRIRIIDPKIDDPAMLTLLDARAAAGVHVEIRRANGVGPLVAHGKLLLVDDSTAVIGSISLSTLALEFRRELAVVTRDGRTLAALERFWRSLPPVTPGVRAVSGDRSLRT